MQRYESDVRGHIRVSSKLTSARTRDENPHRLPWRQGWGVRAEWRQSEGEALKAGKAAGYFREAAQRRLGRARGPTCQTTQGNCPAHLQARTEQERAHSADRKTRKRKDHCPDCSKQIHRAQPTQKPWRLHCQQNHWVRLQWEEHLQNYVWSPKSQFR